MAANEEASFDPDLEGRPRRNKTKKKDLQKKDQVEGEIFYNSFGVPVGLKRNDLRSYVGVVARERIPIIYDDWRKVPLEIKESLWSSLQEKFKLTLKAKKQVLSWMGSSLRIFRSTLVNDFILPNSDNMNSLKKPPIEFEFIKKNHWKAFVAKVLSENFKVYV